MCGRMETEPVRAAGGRCLRALVADSGPATPGSGAQWLKPFGHPRVLGRSIRRLSSAAISEKASLPNHGNMLMTCLS